MGLKLLNSQTNDAKILYLQDQSTWGDGDLPSFSSITHAQLDISYKTPDIPEGSQVYTADVTNVFNSASSQDDLLFPVTYINQPIVDEAVGVNPLPDGVWIVMYTVSNGVTSWSFDANLELLLDAQIKAEIYKHVGSIAYKYYCSNSYVTKPIEDDLLLKSLYDSMQASAYVAKHEEILKILEVLQRQTQ